MGEKIGGMENWNVDVMNLLQANRWRLRFHEFQCAYFFKNLAMTFPSIGSGFRASSLLVLGCGIMVRGVPVERRLRFT
tara:strand:- start:59 stop:292 length:234 start_codon:yes stop_codon:yes gene_type:complete